MAPKLEITKLVKKFVSAIAANDGGKNKSRIDTAKGYGELCNLISGNTVAMTDTDKEYLMGLKVQYENTYMGTKNADSKSDGYGTATPKNLNVPNEPTKNSSAEKNTTPAPTTADAKPPVKNQQKVQPNRANNQPTKTQPKPSTSETQEAIPADKPQKNEANPVKDKKPVNNKPKKSLIKENELNYRRAFNDGEQVAKDLIGYTTNEDKNRAIQTIMKQNSSSIVGFVEGFNKNDTVAFVPYGVGGIIDQIDNENGWTRPEKTRCFNKIINSTLGLAKSARLERSADYKALADISKDLANGSAIDTERADDLVNRLIARIQEQDF